MGSLPDGCEPYNTRYLRCLLASSLAAAFRRISFSGQLASSTSPPPIPRTIARVSREGVLGCRGVSLAAVLGMINTFGVRAERYPVLHQSGPEIQYLYARRVPTLKTPSFPYSGAGDTGVPPPLDKRPFSVPSAPPPESPIGYPCPAGGSGEG